MIKPISLSMLIMAVLLVTAGGIKKPFPQDRIISCIIDPRKQDLQLYYKDDSGHLLASIGHLKEYLERKDKKLIFAMNGGMFRPDNSPVGLFIQQQTTITPLDTLTGNGNFYLKPNGVFYLTKDNKAVICPTADFVDDGQIRFATQSGPMLLINGALHPAFRQGSPNLNIRNGVGLLPGNKLLFAMSKEPISFYDLASWFKEEGCQNALYLDGFVSRTYLPEQNWLQTDGNFGVLIGVSRNISR